MARVKQKRKKPTKKSRSNKRRRGAATEKAGPNAVFSTLTAGVQTLAPKGSNTNVQDALHAVCRGLGRWANLATMALGLVLQDDEVLRHLDRNSTRVGHATGHGLMTVVAKVWRATEEVLKGRAPHKQNPDALIERAVREALRRRPEDLATVLPRPMPHRLKEPLLLDIATELEKLIRLFPQRLRMMLLAKLKQQVGNTVDKKVIEKMAEKLLDEVLAPSDPADTEQARADRFVAIRGCSAQAAAAALRIVIAHRRWLDGLVGDTCAQRLATVRDGEDEVRSSTIFMRTFDAAGLVKLLPPLRDISRWAESYEDSAPSPPAELERADASATSAARLYRAATPTVVAAVEPARVSTVAVVVRADASAGSAAVFVGAAGYAAASQRPGVLSARRSTVATAGDGPFRI